MSKVISGLLESLRIEERPAPKVIPTPLSAELSSSYWAIQLHSSDRLGSTALPLGSCQMVTRLSRLMLGETLLSVSSSGPTLASIDRALDCSEDI